VSVVLDASVVAAFLLPDEKSGQADSIIENASEAGGHVPIIFPPEIRNILLIAERRGRIEPQSLDKDLDDFNTLPRRHRLTIYDALYLELAARKNVPLATFDRALRKAAQEEGLLLPD